MSDRAQAAIGVTLNDIQNRLPAWAKNTVLAGICGSHVHGTWIPPDDPSSTDDVDVFSIIVHPKNHYLGLPYFHGERQSVQTHGESLDINVMEMVHYIDLLARGNPNVNQLLWLQPDEYFAIGAAGQILISTRTTFLSENMFGSFGGYAYGQLKRMTHGERMGYMGAKRKALFDERGFDTKNAAHCVRLFYTALHLVREGTIKPRLEGEELAQVLAIKKGEWTLKSIENLANQLNGEFNDAIIKAKKDYKFPHHPDPKIVDRIVRDVLETQWAEWSQT